MGIRRCAVPTCPSLGCASPCPERRLRCPEFLRDVPVSARIDVPLPDRLVLLALEFFSRPKLSRRHVVTRNLIPHWHPAQFRITPRDALRAVERLTEAVRLSSLRVVMAIDHRRAGKQLS